MEGALASVIGGLVRVPVIAVPTSVGYGASFGGIAALLAMLNSCASGVSVVNIDNGFGAAAVASDQSRLNQDLAMLASAVSRTWSCIMLDCPTSPGRLHASCCSFGRWSSIGSAKRWRAKPRRRSGGSARWRSSRRPIRKTSRGGSALTSEAVAFAKAGGSLATRRARGPRRRSWSRSTSVDEPLEPLQLLGLARFLESVEQRRRSRAGGRMARHSPARPTYCSRIAIRAASFADETAAVHRAILPGGDDCRRASPALRDIREALRRQRAKLRSTLESLTRGATRRSTCRTRSSPTATAGTCVVVRAEHRDAIPGIVHGRSASGASLYLEPLATVALNNDVVALAEREKAEIHRILLALTNAFRLRGDELEALVDVAAELDELYAKARSGASRVDGVAPELTTDGRIEFSGARHPLLIPAVRDMTSDGVGADEATPGALDDSGRRRL